VGGAIARRGRSLISTIALLLLLQDRCAITKTLDVRGVLEVVTKGCVTIETCVPSTADHLHTEHCASHTEGKRQSVRCVTCDDVIAGTCSPVGATSSSRYAGNFATGIPVGQFVVVVVVGVVVVEQVFV